MKKPASFFILMLLFVHAYAGNMYRTGGAATTAAAHNRTAANFEISVVKTADAAEPATPGAFRVSLPTGVLAPENVTIAYSVAGTATPGTDYTAITGTISIAAGTNSVIVPVQMIDNSVIEPGETVIFTISGGTSPNHTYTIAAGGGSATVNITDNDFTPASNVVRMTRISDVLEGGINGQFRVFLPPGVTSSQDVVVSFALDPANTATLTTDYNILGASGGNIVIPAGANQVIIDIDASNDGVIEGPEHVKLTLTGAASSAHPFTIDAANSTGTVNIIDASAASSTPLQVITGNNAAESGSTGTFTVKLAGVATSAWPVTVGYRLSGTADAGSDYVAIGTISIPANRNSITVNLPIVDDQIIEPTETMTITLISGSATDGGGNAFIFPPDPANNNITVNIADDDAAPAANRTLTAIKAIDAAEPSTRGSYTVSLPPGYSSSANTTLSYTMTGTAVRNTDYTIFTITLPAYQNRVSLPVNVVNDQIIEVTETIVLDLNGGTDGNSFTYSASAASNAVLMNLADDDNDPAKKMLSVTTVTNAGEPGTNGLFRISLPAGITCSENITVNYVTTGTATPGSDYTALPANVTLPAGVNNITVPVTVSNDQLIEKPESVTMTLTGGSAASFNFTPAVGSGSATVMITDDENIPANKVVSVVAGPPMTEGSAPNSSITLSLPGAILTSEDITVKYTIGGTALNGTDYTALSGTAVIPAGKAGVTIGLAAVNDQLIENAETVTLTLTEATSDSILWIISTTAGSATLNITDNDNTPANRSLTLTKVTDAAEPNTTGTFRVSLPAGILVSENTTVNYTIGGTATPSADYTTLTGSVQIPAGEGSADIPVAVANDQVIEQTETVLVTLAGGSSTNFTFTGTGNATVNITDDESGVPANLTLSVAKTADVAEPTTNGDFSISIPTGITLAENITVTYTIAGSATAGTDYTALSGTAVIPAGQSAVNIPVTVINDQTIEPDEAVIITLTGGSSANFTFTGTGSATVTIADDENTTPANRELTVSKGADGAEPGTNGSFSISLPAGISAPQDITVNYTISGTATAGQDYTAIAGAIIIPAGQPGVTVPVSIINDQVIEPTETVTITLAGGSSASLTFTGTGSATLNIADDESAVPANLALSIAKTGDAAEPGTNGGITVSLPTGITTSQAITVNITVAGTATPDADYTTIPTTTVIPAGAGSINIPVAVKDDQVIEGAENVIVSLHGGTSAGFTFTGTGNATALLADDDNQPDDLVLRITKTADAAEPATNGMFNIALPAGLTATENITVNYTITGTATGGQDYVLFPGAAVIPAGQNSVNLPLTVTNDGLIEGPETVTAAITNGSSTSFTFTGAGNPTLHITDDDDTPVNRTLSVVKTADAAEPGTHGRFSISLPSGVTLAENVTVTYTIAGSAGAGADYTALSGTAVIPAGQSAVGIPVTVINDPTLEPDETVAITLTGGSSTNFTFTGSGSATVTIADDESADPANRVLTASKNADAAEPGTNGRFTISLPTGISAPQDITINYTMGGTATGSQDYAAITGAIIIPAGQSSVSVPVTVINDQAIEPAETVTITLAGGSSAGLTFTGTGSATVTLTDDDNISLTLQAAATIPAAAEPATNGAFTVSLSGGKVSSEPVTVQYVISGTATPGTDYTAITGAVTIPAGSSTVTIPVTVINDEDVETPETVILRVTGGQSASYAYTAGTAATAEVTITSEDAHKGDLSLTKQMVQPATGPYRMGQDVAYRVVVTNAGTGVSTGVVVKDSLAAQLGLPVRTTASRGQAVVNATDKRLTWTIGDLPAGATVQLEVSGRLVDGGLIAAAAEALSTNTDVDPSNNKAVMTIQVEGSDLLFMNTFTPNGDGRNEKFIIGGLEKYPGSKLQVFNRWGGQVYRSNDYRNDWNGSDLLESTYYYILEVQKPDGTVKSYKGWVLIIR